MRQRKKKEGKTEGERETQGEKGITYIVKG